MARRRTPASAAPGTQPNAEAEAKNLASITGQSVEQIHQAAVVVDGTALSADRPANELIGICNQPRSNVPDLIADFSGTFAMERAAA